MAAIDVTKKLLIYHTLYRLNLSFSNIVTHCRTLQEAGIFTAKYGQLFQAYARELQAEMNEGALEVLHDNEFADLTYFSKFRQARSKELQDPNDVLILAEQRKQQLRREAKRKS